MFGIEIKFTYYDSTVCGVYKHGMLSKSLLTVIQGSLCKVKTELSIFSSNYNVLYMS